MISILYFLSLFSEFYLDFIMFWVYFLSFIIFWAFSKFMFEAFFRYSCNIVINFVWIIFKCNFQFLLVSVVVTLLARCCHVVVTLLSCCCHVVVTLLLRCCHVVVTLLSRCCHVVVTLLSRCCHVVVTLLSRCCLYNMVVYVLICDFCRNIYKRIIWWINPCGFSFRLFIYTSV